MSDPITVVALTAIASSTSAGTAALVGAHFDRVYTSAMLGLLLGPLGLLFTLCAAASRSVYGGSDLRSVENVCFALGPLGLAYGWYLDPR